MASVTTGAKTFDCQAGPLVASREDATHAITFTQLNHRGESLVAQTAFTERLEQVFRLGGFEVLSPTSNLGREDGIEFFTLFERPRGKDTDVCASGI